MEGPFSTGELNAAVGTVFETVEGLIHLGCLCLHWSVNHLTQNLPVDVLVVDEHLQLHCFFAQPVLDSLRIKLFKDSPDCGF